MPAKKRAPARARVPEPGVLYSAKELAAFLPSRRQGRPVTQMTVNSWAVHGVRAGNRIVKLGYLESPKGRVYTKEFLDRFLQELTEARSGRAVVAEATPEEAAERIAAGRRKSSS